MAIDRTLLIERFSRSDVPSYVCPTCKKGTLEFDGKSIFVAEPAYSVAMHGEDWWDPEHVIERFTMMLKCNLKKCGEQVAVSGRCSVEEVPDGDDSWSYESFLVPLFMFPAPPIIRTPEEIPHEVKEQLEMSFQIFWRDAGACATKIRTSVERLMDHYGVAKYKRERGKLKPLALYARIEKFIAATGEVLHQDHLHALRAIGNLGTHSSMLTRADLLETYEVYEHFLDEVVDKKSKSIAKKAKKLRKK